MRRLSVGHGAVEVDGVATDIGAGDVLVIDAGEDHHLVSSGTVHW